MSSQARRSPESTDPTVSVRVLEAVAEAKGTDPVDLVGSLYDVVDPDALDALYGPTGSGVSMAFTFHSRRVSIDERGEVSVEDA